MKIHRASILVLVVGLALSCIGANETDSEVEARKVALDLAGAFSNDGFKLRDGHWSGSISQKEPALIAVNLYAGNQYWFSVGTDGKAKKFTVQVYDENGKPLTGETYADDEKAAAGISPEISGQYFVSVSPSENETGTFCLVYSYK